MKQINIAIIDDHAVLRQGLISLFKEFEEVNVLFDANNGKELLSNLQCYSPDVVLLDIEMPEMGGKETLLNLQNFYPDVKVIMLSTYYSEDFIMEFMMKGARGFLPKEADIEKIITAIKDVYEKGYHFDDKVSEVVFLLEKKKRSNKLDSPATDFTAQEIKIAKLFCLGKSAEIIANELFISKRTVEWHKENIYKKSQTKNLAELIKYSLKQHIITEKEIKL